MNNTPTTTDYAEMSDWHDSRQPWGEDEFFHIDADVAVEPAFSSAPGQGASIKQGASGNKGLTGVEYVV